MLEALELAQENNIKMAELQKKIVKEIGKEKNVIEEKLDDPVINVELLDDSAEKINNCMTKVLVNLNFQMKKEID